MRLLRRIRKKIRQHALALRDWIQRRSKHEPTADFGGSFECLTIRGTGYPQNTGTNDTVFVGFRGSRPIDDQTVRIPITHKAPVKPIRLWLPSTSIGVRIRRIVLNGESFLHGDIAAEIFSEVSTAPPMRWPILEPAGEHYIEVSL